MKNIILTFPLGGELGSLTCFQAISKELPNWGCWVSPPLQHQHLWLCLWPWNLSFIPDVWVWVSIILLDPTVSMDTGATMDHHLWAESSVLQFSTIPP